jgi:hypothetical protein
VTLYLIVPEGFAAAARAAAEQAVGGTTDKLEVIEFG